MATTAIRCRYRGAGQPALRIGFAGASGVSRSAVIADVAATRRRGVNALATTIAPAAMNTHPLAGSPPKTLDSEVDQPAKAIPNPIPITPSATAAARPYHGKSPAIQTTAIPNPISINASTPD